MAAVLMLIQMALATDSPVVAVWAHPVSEINGDNRPGEYIAASYVKWLEQAGARVVPVRYEADDEEVERVFESVNGLLLPGGDVDMPPGARKMVDMALRANRAGDYFPVWGTCLGFEWLAQAISGVDAVVTPGFNAQNISIALDLTPIASASRMLSSSTARSLLSDPSNPVPFNAHSLGITPGDWSKSSNLSDFFSVLSTNVDRNGKPFISTIEAKDPAMPVFATQWHPERNQFEWAVHKFNHALPLEPEINHSQSALSATQHLANFFVSETRKNHHTFPSPEGPYPSLIWHYPIESSDFSIFSQIYLTSHKLAHSRAA